MKTQFMVIALAFGLASVGVARDVLALNQYEIDGAGGYHTLSSPVGSGYGGFSVHIVLDADKFKSALLSNSLTSTPILTVTGGGGLSYGIGLNTTEAGTGIYTGEDGATFAGNLLKGVTSVTNGINETLSFDNLSGSAHTNYEMKAVAITLAVGELGTIVHLSSYRSDTAIIYTNSAYSPDLASSSFGGLTALTVNEECVNYLVVEDEYQNDVLYAGSVHDDVVKAEAAVPEPPAPPAGGAVPEPATATLSLLALGGLAARRRRK